MHRERMGNAMENLAGRLLTLSEVARRLSPVGGKPINPSTVFRWGRGGRIKVVRVGRRILVPEAAVEEFLEQETARWRELHSTPAAPTSPGRRTRLAEAAARRMGIELKETK